MISKGQPTGQAMEDSLPAAGFSVEMLPARHGDCLWVEWGSEGDRHRMLIDGGPKATFKDIRRRLQALQPADRRLDLLVVTHIDLDHIDGVIKLLRDTDLGVEIDDLWFNDHRHTVVAGKRGAIQGEYLAAVIEEQQVPWNRAFDSGAVVVPDDGDLPAIDLDGGLRLTLLSPTPPKLEALRVTWEKTLAKESMTPGDRADALERLDRKGKRAASRTKFGGDGSDANGSSIAFIAEYEQQRWLLAGDAHADALQQGLDRYAAQLGVERVALDGFKVPHHGSVANITPALLERIDCDRFLVSTNGAYFKHPDPACIELLIDSSPAPELVFNYETEFTAPWAQPSERYTSTFGGGAVRSHRTTTGSSPAPDPVPEAPAAPQPLPAPTADDAQPPEREHVAVKVFHGSLEAADHTVMVGHYQATRLSGAERFVDLRLQGRLSDRLAQDAYPGRIGESLRVRAQRRGLPHEGALVVGLGEYGELTPLRLVQSVREALVRHALDVADATDVSDDRPVSLGISTVLMGGLGDQGLGIAGSVRAMLGAVCEANADLRAPGLRSRARYDEVQIWERNAPEAELAYRAVGEMAADMANDDESSGTRGTDALGDLVVRLHGLEDAEGGLLSSLPVESGEPSWWRVQVAAVGEEQQYLQLDFTVGGRMARTGNVTHLVERRRLERLLQGAVSSASPGAGLHATLFELLFPNQLKWDLMAAQDIQLEVDDLTADIPWEMLAARNPDGGTRGELALRAPLVRQLRLPNLATIRRSPHPTALVLGNPPVGTLAASLPGATAEAKAVVEVLEDEYEVTSLCFDDTAAASPETTAAIETALFNDDYRIVHVAAHGMFQPDDPTRTGVAIGEDDFLTAQVFGQLNIVPDLVFLNCCHLGGVAQGIEDDRITFTRNNLNRLGASLARQLIDSGVRAVVVAGWAVGDEAAAAFASTFYEKMLHGASFGQAVHQARLRARKVAADAKSDDSTWGAYQCYGDSGYRLPGGNSVRSSVEDIEPPATRREFLRRLEELISQLETTGVSHATGASLWWVKTELLTLEETANTERWDTERSGWVLQELARGYAALDDTHKAIELYERALTDQNGLATIACAQQVAVIKARHAVELVRDHGDTQRDEARALFKEAFRLIELIEELGGGRTRWALRASMQKRRSTTVTGAERLAAIADSARCYLKSATDQGRVYALANHIQLDHIRRLIEGDVVPDPDVAHKLSGLDGRDTFRAGSFWHAVARADRLVTQALIEDALPEHRDELVDLYLRAFNGRSTASQRASTLNHLQDLAELHPGNAATTALRSIRDELHADLSRAV